MSGTWSSFRSSSPPVASAAGRAEVASAAGRAEVAVLVRAAAMVEERVAAVAASAARVASPPLPSRRSKSDSSYVMSSTPTLLIRS